MTSLLRLYPSEWRDRYEDEFLALLAERRPDARDRLDIVRGAIDARIHPQVRDGRPQPSPDGDLAAPRQRTLGWITLAGGVAWLGALVIAINGPIVVEPGSTYRDGGAALPFVVLAFVMLSAGIFGAARGLPSTAQAGALAAALAIVTGVIWSMMPWMFALFAVTSVSITVLVVSARRARVWRSLDAAVALGGLLAAWLIGVPVLMGIPSLVGEGPDGYAIFWIVLTPLWIAFGHALVAPVRRPALEGPREIV